MDTKVKDYNQLIINFDYEQNFKDDDFYVSKSNIHIFNFLQKWPKWEKNFLNVSGDRFSGKTHLVDIFLKRFKGIKFEASLFNEKNLNEIKVYQNIILENLNEKVDEKSIFTLFNIVEQDNKFLIVTSTS